MQGDETAGLAQVKEQLAACGQSHLLGFWDQLGAAERTGLLEQIGELDLDKISAWVETLVKRAPDAAVHHDGFEPAPSYGIEPMSDAEPVSYTHLTLPTKRIV